MEIFEIVVFLKHRLADGLRLMIPKTPILQP